MNASKQHAKNSEQPASTKPSTAASKPAGVSKRIVGWKAIGAHLDEVGIRQRAEVTKRQAEKASKPAE